MAKRIHDVKDLRGDGMDKKERRRLAFKMLKRKKKKYDVGLDKAMEILDEE